MATNRPFEYGGQDYLDRLNDLFNMGMPRVRTDPDDPESAGTTVLVDRVLKEGDNGCVADCMASVTLTFDETCLLDGWGMFVYAISGTTTISTASVGATFVGGSDSKTVTAGNAAFISCDGVSFRIFRFSAT